MSPPTPEQIQQLWDIHNSPERRQFLLMQSYGFDSTSTWRDSRGYVLSDRIWRARRAVRDQIDQILRQALANGTDALEVAKVLEQYLNPDHAPIRDVFGRLIRNQKKSIVTRAPGRGGMGSFPARRLARTEITRAHGIATIEAAKRTPFATGVKWNLSGRHPKSDPCDENARRDEYKLGAGVYPPEKVPQYPNHPMCLCTLSTVTENDVDAVVDRLREQYGFGDTEPQPLDIRGPLPATAVPFAEGDSPGPLRVTDDLLQHRERMAFIRTVAADDAQRKALHKKLWSHSFRATQELPDDLRASLDNYTSPFAGYQQINRVARGMTTIEQAATEGMAASDPVSYINKTTQNIDRVMKMPVAELPEDVVVYRGAPSKDLFDQFKTAEPGDTYTDWGFGSTTLKPDVAEHWSAKGEEYTTVFQLYAPKGSRAYYAPPVAHYADEQELLFPRGTTFVIHEVQVSGKKVYVRGEIIPDADH